ncbi:MAG: hypothetical protein JWM86_1593 [Thermoleophilia bacterium]|nr:hypothetical protein [Thermoleophilia bacterium]
MQLSSIAPPATSFQRQLGAVVTKLDHALAREDDTVETDLTFRAIDDGVDAIKTAVREPASRQARFQAMDAAAMLVDSRNVIASNWSLEPPHIEVGTGNIGRLGVREAVRLLNEAIASATAPDEY